MDVKFWPCAFHHWIRIDNSVPSRDQQEAPLKLATDTTDDFTNFRTFGCRVWVRPPGRRKAKFKPNSRKGVFLGCLPHTTKNIIWWDPKTNRTKIAKHARFDEGMNDLPPENVPPNATHLQRTQGGEPLPPDSEEIEMPVFESRQSPFSETITKTLTATGKHKQFGFTIGTDELNNRGYVANIKHQSSASKLCSTPKATNNKIRGACIVAIDDEPVFAREEILDCLTRPCNAGRRQFEIKFAPEKRMTAAQARIADREHNPCAPNMPNDLEHSHRLTIAGVRAISALRFPEQDFSCESVSPEEMSLTCNAISSAAITPSELSIGHFTRHKLKQLDTWPEWEAGERKQLDQFHDLPMHGEPVDRPKNAIVLRPHWQHHIKRDGTRRARNCCDGSPSSTPALHGIAQTCSSCVEQPVQRTFFATASQLNCKICGGDAKDAHAHSPPPEVPTFVAIDDACAEWCHCKFGKHVDRNKVLPVLHALQGHPESGRLWDGHVTDMLLSDDFAFRNTTHDKCMHRTDKFGPPIFMLRQVDDFALASPREDIALDICKKLAERLKLDTEQVAPFKCLGLVDDFNGADVAQHEDSIAISCTKCIDRLLQSHGWNRPPPAHPHAASKPTSPLPVDAMPALCATEGPPEGTAEHAAKQAQHGFNYRTLLGELLCAYATCRPDISHAVIALSKFSGSPDDCHCAMLKKVAKHLRLARTWAIVYRHCEPSPDLPVSPHIPIVPDTALATFPEAGPGVTLVGYLDAAHANELKRRRSTTGCGFVMAGAVVSCRCKTQSLTATSSGEAEFCSAVTAAKHARCLRAILLELGFPQPRPTPLCCDNQSAIKMINAKVPTERSRHIGIQFFAMQQWKLDGDIIMQHIRGTSNPSDDLTKPLGWVLHSRHARRLMGHYQWSASYRF